MSRPPSRSRVPEPPPTIPARRGATPAHGCTAMRGPASTRGRRCDWQRLGTRRAGSITSGRKNHTQYQAGNEYRGKNRVHERRTPHAMIRTVHRKGAFMGSIRNEDTRTDKRFAFGDRGSCSGTERVGTRLMRLIRGRLSGPDWGGSAQVAIWSREVPAGPGHDLHLQRSFLDFPGIKK